MKHLDSEVAKIQSSAIIIDTHADTPQRLLDEDYDLASPLNGGNFNIDSAQAGGLAAEFFSIWAEPEQHRGRYARRSLELIDAVHRQAERHPDRMLLVTSADGIEAAQQAGKLAVLLGVEGGHSIEDSLALLRLYHRLGARYMTLTWANSNGWADSSGDEDDPSVAHTADGLSPFGVQVVEEMNRLGMMVDVSHVADRTFWCVLKVSRASVFASHSCARALCDAPRNLTDEMLRAIAHSGRPGGTGGVVMVNFYSAFLSQAYREAMLQQASEVEQAVAELKAARAREGHVAEHREIDALRRSFANRIPRPPFSVLIDHIDHIAKVAGVAHVGLGSDFDGVGGQLPEGMDSAADLPKITRTLLERGYSPEDCRKILGGNFLRYFHEVEQDAACG